MIKTDELLTRRVEKILPSKEGLAKLLSGKKIRLYQGFDPTGGHLHLGHSIGLKKLMEFATVGHEVIFLFGTGTVLVGDPSLRDSARKLITQAEIDENIKTWKTQAAKIVDFNKVKILRNGDWLTKLNLKDIISIGSNISAVQLFKRESFQRRIEKGDTVWYHEAMYPLLQGYDSVAMDVDLEIGGTDQEFNMLIGRELLKKMKNKEKYVLTTPMILGTDGQPMSKTTGNCVWLDDEPGEMYGKLMSVPDSQIVPYLTLCTDVPMTEIGQIEKAMQNGANQEDFNPKVRRAFKAKMALEITKIYHGKQVAQKAATEFDMRHKEGKLPDEIEEVIIKNSPKTISVLLVEMHLAKSSSAARRLIVQGGVKINSQVVEQDGPYLPKIGDLLQVGKRNLKKTRI